MSEPWPHHKPTGAETFWAKKRAALEAEREKLWSKDRVVCSTQLHFDPGTKLGWIVGGLVGYATEELIEELKRRGVKI